ncbi:hypothetical protein GCM10010289_81160 [Streptomyces violascens]|uniref:Uncharacterized protein n=1 Tax=Streptomyces violascens TaxID=67381 RepID=A0ABQ3QRL5_9ACTN|nr:hypothetical protein GCM10010289_81160 [Streptomyces violascens]GHI39908.1 hypothetical protein Sviol_43160 [Streptomyces violascens]
MRRKTVRSEATGPKTSGSAPVAFPLVPGPAIWGMVGPSWLKLTFPADVGLASEVAGGHLRQSSERLAEPPVSQIAGPLQNG